MSTDLQHLLDKIQSEGIDKAKAEGDALLAKAQKEARQIVDAAQQQAEGFRAQSEKDAEAYQVRATEAIRQAGRDLLLNVEKSVQAMMEALMLREMQGTLALPEVLTSLAQETVKGYMAGGEKEIAVHVPKTLEALLPALREKVRQNATQGKVEVVLDANQNSGFSLRMQGGRVEQDFSAEAIVQALSKTLRPQLAALLKPEK